MRPTSLRFLGFLLITICCVACCSAVCPGSSHQTSIAGFALSPDATRIAAVAEDGTLFWWDVASGKRTQLMECIAPEAFGHPILFSPDSARLAVVVYGAVHVFDLSTGNMISRLTIPKLKSIYNIAFSADGRRLAAIDEERAVIWDINSQAEIASIPARASRKALALNRDGSLLALGTSNGIELWSLPAARIVRKLAEGIMTESLIFASQDQRIVALTATPLPPKPKQRFQEYNREISIWDSATGKKLRTLKPEGAEIEELRFGLATGGSRGLFAADYKDRLWIWDLDTGVLKATWETSTGHPSADGKFLLRDGGAPGQLELWEIGSSDEKARTFVYRSPLCTETLFTGSTDGKVKFEGLFIADGYSEDDAPIGSSNTIGYVAPDCSSLNYSSMAFKTPERAKQELARRTAQADRIIEKGPPKDLWQQVLLGPRVVAYFSRKYSWPGINAVMWVEGSSYHEISSISLPAVLALERQFLEQAGKR
jgi:WD40 repeat protein